MLCRLCELRGARTAGSYLLDGVYLASENDPHPAGLSYMVRSICILLSRPAPELYVGEGTQDLVRSRTDKSKHLLLYSSYMQCRNLPSRS